MGKEEKGSSLLDLVGNEFICKDGDKTCTFDKLKDAKAVCIYFSAHWRPPCRGFTPVLTKASEDGKWRDAGVEVIFVTSDQDDKSFQGYFAEMGEDWLALPFGNEQIKVLKQKFNVQGIPTLVVVGQDGEIIDDNAR